MRLFRGFREAGLGEDLPSHERRDHQSRRRRLAIDALSTCLAFSVLGLLACATATARVEPKVRVLLYNGSDPIKVGRMTRLDEVKLSGSGGLLVDGREEASGWMPRGLGPWRVGSRTVRGQIAVMAEEGRIQVLNRIGLEDYVA